MAFAVEAAVYCPANHCLQRAYNCTTADSYTCEQYPDTGYQCAGEKDPRGCTCNGKVKYGNHKQAKANATWGPPKNVSNKTDCDNEAGLGHAIGGAKVCWCSPSSPTVTKRA